MNKNWPLIIIAAFVLGLGIKSYLQQQNKVKPVAVASSAVTLYGKDNQVVSLFDEHDQRIRVIYFGFTRCPDVCPTSLAMLGAALNKLDEETKKRFWPIFISLDPQRDAAADSHQYAQYFHPMIKGLSAPLNVVTPLAHQYGVIFRQTELKDSQLKYTLDHNSYFYFIKPNGKLITKVAHTLTPDPLVAAFNALDF